MNKLILTKLMNKTKIIIIKFIIIFILITINILTL